MRLGGGDDTATDGAGADSFEFFGSSIGADHVTDFTSGTDRLGLDDALWTGTLTARQVVDQFADASGGNVVFDFGDGNSITLDGVTDTATLADDLFIFCPPGARLPPVLRIGRRVPPGPSDRCARSRWPIMGSRRIAG